MAEGWEKSGVYMVPCRVDGSVSLIEIAAINMEDAKRKLRAHGYEVVDRW